MNRFKNLLAPLAWIFSSIYILFLYRVIPFISLPSSAINTWAIGFARSIANGPWFSIYASNIGYPRPAGVSFGLPGILPTAWLIKLGVAGVDAYIIVFATFLILGFIGSARLARHLGLQAPYHILAGLVWMTLPILWRHTYFSYLSIGFMLLPIYAGVYFWIQTKLESGVKPAIIGALVYNFALTFALFMDGYSFIFMLSVHVILGAASMVNASQARRRATLIGEIVLVIGLFIAVRLYTGFFGQSGVYAATIEFIRGFGLDLSFLVFPTQGLYWFFDALKLSVPRNYTMFFGDDSVWLMSYITPLLLFSVAGVLITKLNKKQALPYLIILLIGFYLSLGPSLKINSVKPANYASIPHIDQGQSMEAKYAIMPTGSQILYEIAPPLRVMRASYRWLVLAGFGAWALWSSIGAASTQRGKRVWVVCSIAMLVVTSPNIKQHYLEGVANREYVASFEGELFPTFQNHIQPGEVAVFYPIGNDFLINEIAAAGNFSTYNIGGDKNFAAAQTYWPTQFAPLVRSIEQDPVMALNALFEQRLADVVVVPFFNLFQSSFKEAPYSANLTPENNPELMEQFKDVLTSPDFDTTVTDLAIFIRPAR